MASNNNEHSGAILAIAAIGMMAYIMFALIFAAAVFLSVCLTVVSIAAWHKPIDLFGQQITPQEARAFVYRGLLGAIILSTFIGFASALYQVRINQDFLIYMPLAGYAFGSLVVGYWIEEAREEEAARAAHSQLMPPRPPIRTIDAETVRRPYAKPAPFRFASWDDEEELRK